jgi:hypothetical protein
MEEKSACAVVSPEAASRVGVESLASKTTALLSERRRKVVGGVVWLGIFASRAVASFACLGR